MRTLKPAFANSTANATPMEPVPAILTVRGIAASDLPPGAVAGVGMLEDVEDRLLT